MVANFKIDTTELSRLATTVAGAAPVVKRHSERAGMASGFLAQGNSQREAPVKTGTLKSKIGPPKVKQSGISTTVEVKSHAAYSVPVHEGRGEVRPVHAKVLRWEGPNGIVFSMKSKAVAANPYMDRGLKQSESGIVQAFDKALADAMRELGL